MTIRKTTKGSNANYRPTKKGAGMTAKGVARYRKANPGSKLKTAVTKKSGLTAREKSRRKSYCARSLGQLRKVLKMLSVEKVIVLDQLDNLETHQLKLGMILTQE